MAHSITTSIRLPQELRDQLEYTANKLQRGKNWIVIEALKEYLRKYNHEVLSEKARQQSIIASQKALEDSIWEENIDDSDWRY